MLSNVRSLPPLGPSDYVTIQFGIAYHFSLKSPVSLTKYNFWHGDSNAINNELNGAVFEKNSYHSVDEQWAAVNCTIQQIIE